jgi:3-dehydroquinate synthase
MNKVEIGAIEANLTQFLTTNNYTKIFVIADENTVKHCYPMIIESLGNHEIVQIKSGEGNKNITTCSLIWERMTNANLDRHALVINLGGGVIGDMGGFCAATYKRGIDFIQIPTTLLAQVDASVGGKLGIDFQSFKNHIGVFKVPNSVLIDPIFLQTLPISELRSGFAEVIKHCLIADFKMWETIIKNDFNKQDITSIIAHSVALKSKITEADPTEKGIRKILNFGHTLGHAIETFYLGSKNHLLHGEAIAIGMICESYLSVKKQLLEHEDLETIQKYITSNYGSIKIFEDDFDGIINLSIHDKKNKGEKVLFTLLSEIGISVFDIEISKIEMKEALNYYKNLTI